MNSRFKRSKNEDTYQTIWFLELLAIKTKGK